MRRGGFGRSGRGGEQEIRAGEISRGVYAYLRALYEERALVVFNRSDNSATAALPIARVGSLRFHDWLDSSAKVERQGDNLIITLPKPGFAVLGH